MDVVRIIQGANHYHKEWKIKDGKFVKPADIDIFPLLLCILSSLAVKFTMKSAGNLPGLQDLSGLGHTE
jgi:hypothetical protein